MQQMSNHHQHQFLGSILTFYRGNLYSHLLTVSFLILLTFLFVNDTSCWAKIDTDTLNSKSNGSEENFVSIPVLSPTPKLVLKNQVHQTTTSLPLEELEPKPEDVDIKEPDDAEMTTTTTNNEGDEMITVTTENNEGERIADENTRVDEETTPTVYKDDADQRQTSNDTDGSNVGKTTEEDNTNDSTQYSKALIPATIAGVAIFCSIVITLVVCIAVVHRPRGRQTTKDDEIPDCQQLRDSRDKSKKPKQKSRWKLFVAPPVQPYNWSEPCRTQSDTSTQSETASKRHRPREPPVGKLQAFFKHVFGGRSDAVRSKTPSTTEQYYEMLLKSNKNNRKQSTNPPTMSNTELTSTGGHPLDSQSNSLQMMSNDLKKGPTTATVTTNLPTTTFATNLPTETVTTNYPTMTFTINHPKAVTCPTKTVTKS